MQLGVLKNMQAPEGRITGVTYALPVETQFEIFKAILPNLKSLLLLLEEGHPSNTINQEETKAICSTMGIRYHDKICSSTQDAVAAVAEFKGKVSAILLGSNRLVYDNAPNIVSAAGKVPVLSYLPKPVEAGALGGFLADDIKLGRMLAESVADVLIKGKAVRDVPVKADPDPIFTVNVRTAEKLGIEIPFHILKKARVIEN